jgi:hypothetical protein
MNTWVSFNLYIATSVLIEGCASPEAAQESRNNLDFLLKALQVIGRKQIVTQAFIAQLKIDLEIAGIRSPFGNTVVSLFRSIYVCVLIYRSKRGNGFGAFGTPSILARNVNSRVTEFSADLLNQSIFSTGIASSISGGSESCSTSDKDSATPPQDLHSTLDLLGVLPKSHMVERLRRTYAPSKVSNQQEQNMAYGLPKTFNIPALFLQPISRDSERKSQQNRQSQNISTSGDSQSPSFPSPFESQQQFMKSDTNGHNMQKNPLGSYSGNVNDSAFSNWAFGSMDDSVPTGFSGFDFPTLVGEDINSLLNGAAWNDPIFQA